MVSNLYSSGLKVCAQCRRYLADRFGAPCIRSHSRSYVDAPMDVSRIATCLSSLTEFAAKYRSTCCKYVLIESDAGQNSLSVPNVAMTRGQLSFILVSNCNDLAIRMVGITS